MVFIHDIILEEVLAIIVLNKFWDIGFEFLFLIVVGDDAGTVGKFWAALHGFHKSGISIIEKQFVKPLAAFLTVIG